MAEPHLVVPRRALRYGYGHGNLVSHPVSRFTRNRVGKVILLGAVCARYGVMDHLKTTLVTARVCAEA